MINKINCEICGTEVITNNNSKKYCNDCRKEVRSDARKGIVRLRYRFDSRIAKSLALKEFNKQKQPINKVEKIEPFDRKLPNFKGMSFNNRLHEISWGSQERDTILSIYEHQDAALNYIKYIL